MRRPTLAGWGWACSLLGLLAGTLAAAEPARVIRVGVLTDNFPYSFREGGGPVQGFTYELMAGIEQAMDLKLERIMGTTAEINAAFAAGRVDALQSLAHFPERDSAADFTISYLTAQGAIFVREHEDDLRSVADLRGRKVFVHRGSFGETVLRRAGLEASIVHVESVEDALRRLERGEGDATLASRLSGLALVQHLGLKQVRCTDAKVEGYEVRYCIAVQEGDARLLAQMNEGLAILVRTGRFEEIYRKWFGHLEAERYSPAQVFGAVAAGLALALGVAIWAAARQRRLRSRIAQQAEALRASEERYRRVFEGVGHGLLVLTRAGGELAVEQLNPAAARLLGREAGAERTPLLMALLPADPVLTQRISAAAARGTAEEFEHERPGPGGWLRVGVSPLGDRVLVMLADITGSRAAR